jgi:hypothetical protein
MIIHDGDQIGPIARKIEQMLNLNDIATPGRVLTDYRSNIDIDRTTLRNRNIDDRYYWMYDDNDDEFLLIDKEGPERIVDTDGVSRKLLNVVARIYVASFSGEDEWHRFWQSDLPDGIIVRDTGGAGIINMATTVEKILGILKEDTLPQPGDVLTSPRFGKITIKESFDDVSLAHEAGYTEPAHIYDMPYVVYGKCVSVQKRGDHVSLKHDWSASRARGGG